jgi:hypothetical protein
MAKNAKKTEAFGVQEYLSKAGLSRRIAKFKKGQVIFRNWPNLWGPPEVA